MSKPRVAIGIPYYGPQEAAWWAPLAAHAASFHNMGLEFGGIIPVGVSTTDKNRNSIVKQFLEQDLEWLWWIDADTVPPLGALKRLIALGKTLVSGIYYGKADPYPPIAYYQTVDHAYKPIDQLGRWEPGEILAVNACGMGCMLTHRGVFEDILENFGVFQRISGGLTLVHKDKIHGPLKPIGSHPREGHMHKGIYYERLVESTLQDLDYPFFVCEYGRTEDFWFFERAREVGHRPWLDTGVECKHLNFEAISGELYRQFKGLAP